MKKKEIQKMMNKLEISREEAIEMLQEDEQINRMTVAEAQSDLTAEQKKAVKSATKTGSRKRTAVKRERKVDRRKKFFIDKIYDCLNGCLLDDKPEKVNETEIHFTYIGEKYTVKLIKHRPKK